MSEADGSSIAFIGLGNMGGPMAVRLLQAGLPVTGFDLAAGARDRLVAAGGSTAASAAEAVAEAEVVILVLPDSSVVETVLVSPEMTSALRRGSVVVDMSSSEPDRTRALAGRLQDAGVALIDAPVSGGVARARTGELAVMVGGEDDTIARVEPILGHFGRVFRAGPVGAGHAVKALNNLMSATHLLVSSEAIIAGRAFGLDPEVILGIVNASSGRSASTENKWPNFILNRTFDSGFSLRLMLKDMRIACGLAERLGSPDALARRAVEIWADAAAALPQTADHTEIARWLSRETAATR